MASHLLDAAFVSIGLVDRRNPRRINFSSNLTNGDGTEIKQWAIDLTRHPTLNAAFIQGQTVELLPTGLGARQLHEFYGSFGIDPLGSLLIHPLVNNGSHIGLLVIAATEEQEQWTEDQKSLVPGLASYISQAVINSQLPAVRFTAVPPAPEPRNVTETVPSAILLDQVRLSSLEAERDELKSALEEAIERRKQAEEKALGIQKQARYLAAALRDAQESKQEQVVDQVQMNTAITGTRETTTQSEEPIDS
jgi:GAF domain-containing protein